MPETGYGLGEGLIATLIKTISGFTEANVSRADWSVLNNGKAAVYAILYPGEYQERSGNKQVTEGFVTSVQVWRQYSVDGTTWTNLCADAETILKKIESYPHLGDTSGYVVDSEPTLSLPEEMWRAGGGPAWLRQIINVRWTGQRTRTFLD